MQEAYHVSARMVKFINTVCESVVTMFGYIDSSTAVPLLSKLRTHFGLAPQLICPVKEKRPMAESTAAAQPKPHVVHYTVDGEPQETTEHMLTPVQIMQKAGIDPNTHYLVELVGNHRKSYQDAPNEPINIH